MLTFSPVVPFAERERGRYDSPADRDYPRRDRDPRDRPRDSRDRVPDVKRSRPTAASLNDASEHSRGTSREPNYSREDHDRRRDYDRLQNRPTASSLFTPERSRGTSLENSTEASRSGPQTPKELPGRASRSSPPTAANPKDVTMKEANGVQDEDEDQDDSVDPALAAMMGFGGFGTTAQKQVTGNVEYGNAEVKKERKYR